MPGKKMIIEMRTYLFESGTVPAFMELIRHCHLKSATENSNLLATPALWSSEGIGLIDLPGEVPPAFLQFS